MSEPKHTPGPWQWWTSNSWRRLKRDDRGIQQTVLEPYVMIDGHPDVSVSDADMALIAAAPDLYAALEAAQEELRLIRMKDTNAVYNPMLRMQMALALEKAKSTTGGR